MDDKELFEVSVEAFFAAGRVVEQVDGSSGTVVQPYGPCDRCGTKVVGLIDEQYQYCLDEVEMISPGVQNGKRGWHVTTQTHTPELCRAALGNAA
jgi:hypothetical protein